MDSVEGLPNRFRLIRRLGGTSADVYLAHDGQRDLVLKVWRGRAGSALLAEEAAVLERIRHPGVVRVLEFGPLTEGAYLATEYVPGPTLLGWTGHGTSEVLALGAAVARALGVVHAKGVVHGDISPSNIVVAAGDRPVVIDFGLAHEIGRPPRRDGGSLPYVAPERFLGEVASPSSDLYGLGTSLRRVLTGKVPAAIEALCEADPRDRPASGEQAADLLLGGEVKREGQEHHEPSLRGVSLERGGAWWVTAPGSGRRFLAEVRVEARARGLPAVGVEASAEDGPFAPLPSLLRRVLEVVPGGERTVAGRDRARAFLEAVPHAPEGAFGHMQLFDEVAGAFADLSRGGPWLATIDEAGEIDNDARALLAHVMRRLQQVDGRGLLFAAGPEPPRDLQGEPIGVERDAALPLVPDSGRALVEVLVAAGHALPLAAVELLVQRGAVPASALRVLTTLGVVRVSEGEPPRVRLADPRLRRDVDPSEGLIEAVARATLETASAGTDPLDRARHAIRAGDREEGLRDAFVAARLAAAQGAHARAIEAFQLALPLIEDDSPAWVGAAVELGRALRDGGRLHDAIPLLERALERADSATASTVRAVLASTFTSSGQAARALELCQATDPETPDREATDPETPDLLSARATALLRLGRYSEAIADLEAAQARLPSEDPRLPAQLESLLGVAWKEQGDYDRAVEHNRRSLELAREVGDIRRQCAVLLNLGSVNLDRSRYDVALRDLDSALAIARRTGLRDAEAICLNNIGAVRQGQGRLEDAQSRYEEVLAIARACGDRYSESLATSNLGNIALRRGRLEEAAAHYRESLAIRSATGDLRGQTFCRWHLGQVEIERRRYQAALEPLGQALIDAEDSAGELVPQVLYDIARARLGLEDAEGALRILERAMRRADHAEEGIRSRLRGLRGRVHLVRGEDAAAADDLASSLDRLEQVSEPGEVRALLCLGRLRGGRELRRSILRATKLLDAFQERGGAPLGVERLLAATASDDPPPAAAIAGMPSRAPDDHALEGRAALGWGIVRALAGEPPESFLPRAVEELVRFSGAAGGGVVLLLPDGQRAVVAATGAVDDTHFSQTLVDRALSAGAPLLIDDASSLAALRGARSVSGLGIRAALTIPIPGTVGPAGVLVVCDPRPGQLGAADLELAGVLGGLMSAALRSTRLATELQALTDELSQLREAGARPPRRRGAVPLLVGGSLAIRKLRKRIARLAASDLPVLVTGETGSGKELVARAIHEGGARGSGPFTAIPCAALAEGLLEAELFGVVQGAFTGAVESRPGRLEQTSGGTLLLDELADTTLELQAKLLRVIEEGEVRRVGGQESIPLDLRWVATTTADLEARVEDGRFRGDLLYRLNAATIAVPPLRKRKEDVPLLCEHFLGLAKRRGQRPIELSEVVLEVLRGYRWPGNVRELANLIGNLCSLYPGEAIGLDHLPARFREAPERAPTTLAEIERESIVRAIEQSGGVKSHAAKLLGIPRRTLYDKLKRYGI